MKKWVRATNKKSQLKKDKCIAIIELMLYWRQNIGRLANSITEE